VTDRDGQHKKEPSRSAMEAQDSRKSEFLMVRSSATGGFLVVDHMLPFYFVECSVEASIGKVRLRLRLSPQRFL
jgi:hypothetical protein